MSKQHGRAPEDRTGKITPGQFAAITGLVIPNLWKAVQGMDFDTAQRWVTLPASKFGGALVPALRCVFMTEGSQLVLGSDAGRLKIPINRSTPFDPAEFLGQGWSIWKGPAAGDGLSGDEEQDERSLALTEVDLSQIRFETCLKDREDAVKGEEKLKRLKESGHIRLDVKIFQTLWNNKYLIPANWKEKINGNTRFIFFDGTTLRGPDGYRYVLCLYFSGGGWRWFCFWLGDVWGSSSPSAVLAS